MESTKGLKWKLELGFAHAFIIKQLHAYVNIKVYLMHISFLTFL